MSGKPRVVRISGARAEELAADLLRSHKKVIRKRCVRITSGVEEKRAQPIWTTVKQPVEPALVEMEIGNVKNGHEGC